LAKLLTEVQYKGKVIISTQGEDALANMNIDLSDLKPCNHEEADTRLLLHAAHARATGSTNILIRTVDTDVVVLAIAMHHQIGEGETWVAFGTGDHLKYIAAHVIAEKLGHSKSQALPFFHAFSGCDTVSAVNGRGKKTAWEVWKVYPEVTV
jgi:hypothetical protein